MKNKEDKRIVMIGKEEYFWDDLKLSFGKENNHFRKKPAVIEALKIEEDFKVHTKEGVMKGKAGDFLIKGVEGELYPCDVDIFWKTYDIA